MNEISKLYQQDYSIRELAEKFNKSKDTIRRILKKDGVHVPYKHPNKGKEFLGADGRWRIRLDDGTVKRRYVWVMEQYLGHPIPDGYMVHHKDHDPQNDDLSNLELKTRKKHLQGHNPFNQQEDKTKSYTGKHHNAKLTIEQSIEIIDLYSTGEYSLRELAEMYNLSSKTTISKIIRKGRQYYE